MKSRHNGVGAHVDYEVNTNLKGSKKMKKHFD